MNKLLKHLGTVIIPATTENFVAKDKFIINTSKNALVKISYIGSNFFVWFHGKIEKPKAETALRYAKLVKSSVNGPILAELGDKAETTLGDVYSLMEKQRNGKRGVLLTNDYSDVFYVRDINNTLRAVDVFWGGDGWHVYARLLGSLGAWDSGYRVFCNS